MERIAAEVFGAAKKRWLYVSADSRNRAALRFYRRLGFTAVGRLPDLVSVGRSEILLRRGA
jgi:ribosomal protein S18 acetylase RimI-like enzyme